MTESQSYGGVVRMEVGSDFMNIGSSLMAGSYELICRELEDRNPLIDQVRRPMKSNERRIILRSKVMKKLRGVTTKESDPGCPSEDYILAKGKEQVC